MIKFHRARNYYAKQNCTSRKYFSFFMYVLLLFFFTANCNNTITRLFLVLLWVGLNGQFSSDPSVFIPLKTCCFLKKTFAALSVRFCLGSFLTFHVLISVIMQLKITSSSSVSFYYFYFFFLSKF